MLVWVVPLKRVGRNHVLHIRRGPGRDRGSGMRKLEAAIFKLTTGIIKLIGKGSLV